jgi:nudix-type nucleoside diphosphatase (YffH/AdpP family)
VSNTHKRDDVHVQRATTLHDGSLKLIELRYEAPGTNRDKIAGTREIVVRQDAAAALVHDIERDIVILSEQFRPAAYQAGHSAWFPELVAGKIDGDESAEDCIRRELLEEIGYRARALDPIGVYFASAGYSTERVHLFYAPVSADDLVEPDAHGVDDSEDVRRVEQPVKAFLERIRLGKFEDGKIMAAGAWAITRLGSP